LEEEKDPARMVSEAEVEGFNEESRRIGRENGGRRAESGERKLESEDGLSISGFLGRF